MVKMKERRFHQLTRQEQACAVLWPSQTTAEIRKEMTEISAKNGKKAPYQEPLLSDQQRGAVSPLGGKAK
jgi:hypothetical protein